MIDKIQHKDELILNFLDSYLREADSEAALNFVEKIYYRSIREVVDEMMGNTVKDY